VFAYFHQRPELAMRSGDTALFSFISTELKTPIPGLVIAAMLAAVISTLNAVFNSMAAVYVKELHLRYFNLRISESNQVKVSRIATVCIGIIACALGILITYSAEWLSQSVVEASTIFNAFDAIVIPAFVFAVLSRKASTLLVWVTAGSVWGVKLAMVTWYFASTAAFNQWKPGMPSSWAGPIEYSLALPFLLCGGVVMMFWTWLRYRKMRFGTPTIVLGMVLTGFGLGILVWAFFSQLYCQEEAHALSFQWLGFPAIVCYTAIGLLWLFFGKIQKKEKYEGLTLFSSGATSRGEK
jgi:Na+/proline symporter